MDGSPLHSVPEKAPPSRGTDDGAVAPPTALYNTTKRAREGVLAWKNRSVGHDARINGRLSRRRLLLPHRAPMIPLSQLTRFPARRPTSWIPLPLRRTVR